ncbi:MAG: asparagine synthase (glutamine-hydrolyzing) [Phycisphaerae bacterium]
MCGIAGVCNPVGMQAIDADGLRRMADAIVHRGPDGEGFYVDTRGHCGLAFRRLAIIDLNTGDQPMSNEDGSLQLVFNGEIYNYRTLRSELAAQGHQFRTQSDSEVIVHAFEEWGTDSFTRLEGMFAIAIWNCSEKVLTLARDRFGKKPLYYATDDHCLCFASEVKAIHAYTQQKRAIDYAALNSYLTMQYVPAPESIFKNVKKLPGGHWLQFAANAAATPTIQSFWQVPRPTPFAGTYEEALTALDEHLTRSVQKRLIADVPLGAFLSGGIDSSIVVALMHKLGVAPLRTFSIGFNDPRYNEAQYARRIAEIFQTEHHEHIVKPTDPNIFDALATHYDEPFADSSAIPTLQLSRWTAASVKVALTGDAGDECFGGYDRYRAALLAQRGDVVPATIRRALAAVAPRLLTSKPKTRANRLRRFLIALGLPAARRYADWMSVFTPTMLREGYRADIAARVGPVDQPWSWVASLWREADAHGDAAKAAAYTDLRSYLPGDLLTKVDIASMACGLECRSPFLDHHLVEFALSLPTQWKVDSRGGKRILKEWARQLLPEEILNRPKMGFGVPVGDWFRAELRAPLRDALLSSDGICAQLFEENWRQKLLDQHQTQQSDHGHRLWALFMLDRWHRRWERHITD